MYADASQWYAMSDPAILETLGAFIRKTRLEKNKTQQDIALAAGINRSTMVQLEKGGGATLVSFVQVLRALEQLHLLQAFQKQIQISPLQSSNKRENEQEGKNNYPFHLKAIGNDNNRIYKHLE
jgi:transcriptional regulator with XRE-family HTH domain